MESKTYLKAVQEMRRHLVQAYNLAGTLRDYGTSVEKGYFNYVRGTVSIIDNKIEDLEQHIIANDRNDMKL